MRASGVCIARDGLPGWWCGLLGRVVRMAVLAGCAVLALDVLGRESLRLT